MKHLLTKLLDWLGTLDIYVHSVLIQKFFRGPERYISVVNATSGQPPAQISSAATSSSTFSSALNVNDLHTPETTPPFPVR